jgi:hypothetical protein
VLEPRLQRVHQVDLAVAQVSGAWKRRGGTGEILFAGGGAFNSNELWIDSSAATHRPTVSLTFGIGVNEGQPRERRIGNHAARVCHQFGGRGFR